MARPGAPGTIVIPAKAGIHTFVIPAKAEIYTFVIPAKAEIYIHQEFLESRFRGNDE